MHEHDDNVCPTLKTSALIALKYIIDDKNNPDLELFRATLLHNLEKLTSDEEITKFLDHTKVGILGKTDLGPVFIRWRYIIDQTHRALLESFLRKPLPWLVPIADQNLQMRALKSIPVELFIDYILPYLSKEDVFSSSISCRFFNNLAKKFRIDKPWVYGQLPVRTNYALPATDVCELTINETDLAREQQLQSNTIVPDSQGIISFQLRHDGCVYTLSKKYSGPNVTGTLLENGTLVVVDGTIDIWQILENKYIQTQNLATDTPVKRILVLSNNAFVSVSPDDPAYNRFDPLGGIYVWHQNAEGRYTYITVKGRCPSNTQLLALSRGKFVISVSQFGQIGQLAEIWQSNTNGALPKQSLPHDHNITCLTALGNDAFASVSVVSHDRVSPTSIIKFWCPNNAGQHVEVQSLELNGKVVENSLKKLATGALQISLEVVDKTTGKSHFTRQTLNYPSIEEYLRLKSTTNGAKEVVTEAREESVVQTNSGSACPRLIRQ